MLLHLNGKPTTMAEKNYVLTKEVALEKLHRMALEIAEDISEEETPLRIVRHQAKRCSDRRSDQHFHTSLHQGRYSGIVHNA